MPVSIQDVLLSQGVADAMGETFEFVNAMPERVRAFRDDEHKHLHITDDTQMAMFGYEGLLRMTSGADLTPVRQAYLDWYETQRWDHPDNFFKVGLKSRRAMWQSRAPGATCLGSLNRLEKDPTFRPSGDKGGCGTVMRLAPFAWLYTLPGLTIAEVQSIAMESALITHSGPTTVAAVQLYMLHAMEFLLHGRLGKTQYTAQKITAYGEGWDALSCVRMAMWAVQHAHDYGHLLELAISHRGDSDSVAAVAGGLWALAGFRGWEKYVPQLKEAADIVWLTGQPLPEWMRQPPAVLTN